MYNMVTHNRLNGVISVLLRVRRRLDWPNVHSIPIIIHKIENTNYEQFSMAAFVRIQKQNHQTTDTSIGVNI